MNQICNIIYNILVHDCALTGVSKVIVVFTTDKFLVVCEYTGITINVGKDGTEGIKASRITYNTYYTQYTNCNTNKYLFNTQ